MIALWLVVLLVLLLIYYRYVTAATKSAYMYVPTLATSHCIYRCGYAPFQVFKRMGVPGPPPLPFLGNYLEPLLYVSICKVQMAR